jgi:tail assembly chaperone
MAAIPTVQTIEKEINGVRYRLTQVGAIEGRELLLILARVLGSLAFGGSANIAQALMGATPADLARFCEVFERQTAILIVDEKKQQGVKARWLPLSSIGFDSHFAARYLEMCLWLQAHLEINFRSFFIGLQGHMAQGPATDSLNSASPTLPTGTSGESLPASEST